MIGADDIEGLVSRIEELQVESGAGRQAESFINTHGTAIRVLMPDLARDAMSDICARTNPVALTEENVTSFVESTLARGGRA